MSVLVLCTLLVLGGVPVSATRPSHVKSLAGASICSLDCDQHKLAPDAQKPESGYNTLSVIDKIGTGLGNALRSKGIFGDLGSDAGYLGLGVLLGVEAAIPEAPSQAEWYDDDADMMPDRSQSKQQDVLQAAQ